MRRLFVASSLLWLSGCDFDGDWAKWRCAHGFCAEDDAGFDAGLDAGLADGGTDGGADAGHPADAGPYAFDAGPFAPDGSYNFVFVTSQTLVPADLRGLAAADALCAASARDAGLPGTYGAWLAADEVSAGDRIGMDRARGWLRVDGRPFADTLAGLQRGISFYPPRLDEHGVDLGLVEVLTGALADGISGSDCFDWTGSGLAQAGCSSCGGSLWTASVVPSCTTPLHLYCFGVDQARQIVLPPRTGPLIFVSLPWDGIGGLLFADLECNAEGAGLDAGAPFIALVATTTASAQSRLVSDGGWTRLDGVVVGDLRSAQLDAPPSVRIDGAYDGTMEPATGSPSFSASGTTQSTCSDWNMLGSSTTATLVTGNPLRTDFKWFNDSAIVCGRFPLYCVQP